MEQMPCVQKKGQRPVNQKIVDMHCDTVAEIFERERKGKKTGLRENGLQLDLKRMEKSGYLLQNFALFVDQEECTDPWERVCALYEIYARELSCNEEKIVPVLSYEDIVTNEKTGKLSALLTVEEGAVCKGEAQKLQKLYHMGVRMMTLTWNYPNELGYPNRNGRPEKEKGLTERGREFVFWMERMGMIVDVSHLSDKGFYDVLECTKKPFVASHSNARAVCPCARNLTDSMIRSLGERGGVMGLNYYVDFLLEAQCIPRGKEARIQAILNAAVNHARHIVDVGGMEVLGLGSDFDGIDVNEALPGAQSVERLWDALHGAGFTQSQLDGIFSENVLRVYREILK